VSRHCVVVEHLAIEHAGTLKPVLEGSGYTVTPVSAAAIGEANGLVQEADLLLVMGGPIGVCDAPEYPYLTAEIDLIRDRLRLGRAVLGICLGSQLMAAALGAKVYPGTAGVELGWGPIALTEQGREHALAHIAGQSAPVLHWHGDTFDLPLGTTLLASTGQYRNQAFSFGRHGLALQFHVETDLPELEQWFVAFANDIRALGNGKLSTLRADTLRFAEDLRRRNARFVGEWISGLAAQGIR
jgi:GMP synthase (glutamine-hydrolysing)